MITDTIAAIATAFGEGAIAVLRVNGPDALTVANRVFEGKRPVEKLPARIPHFGRVLFRGESIDDVLLTVFRKPSSYTGEDLVEISCHGGILVTRRILDALLASGARMANPGEFTQRAFLNGKMDLTQAEAVMDLIRAQTDLALRAAHEQLEGRLGRRVNEIRELLLNLLAHVEAFIDFPEEDIDPETGQQLVMRIDSARALLAELLRTADQGRVLREGVRTVIAGPPNAGKSSLLNVFLGFERAIVSEHPGTTRDTIEEVIALRGVPFRLIDTAGIRHSTDHVEREGIARTHRHLERADLILRIYDGTLPPPPEVSVPQPHELLVCNKVDLPIDPGWKGLNALAVSCTTGAGIDLLTESMTELVLGGTIQMSDPGVAINARHQACLQESAKWADATRQALIDRLSPEFVAVDLRAALDSVGEVVGKIETDDLLDRVFSTFCLGK